jgi:pimeloyl-ACP methyl ester carboxylesterase
MSDKHKTALVILHGVSGSGTEMAPLAGPLSAWFDVRVPNLLGHGGRPVPDGYTLEEMADDLVQWLDGEGIGRAYFLGYSLGGYLALFLARRHPQRVRGIAGIVVKHVFDEASVAHITYLADPERLARPGNPRKDELIAIHGEANWVNVTNNTARLFQRFGSDAPLSDDDLRAIETPVLLLSGDRDPLVPAADARALAELLPNARLGLFPGPAHPLKTVPTLDVVRAIKSFVDEVEGGRFTGGETLDLAPQLVTGGTGRPGIRVTIGKARR